MARLSEAGRRDSVSQAAAERKSAPAKTAKLNCWEFKKCGREPGGHKEKELGTCPVTVHGALDGAHEGIKGGRACWVIAGSLCGGKIQGTYAQKLTNCWRCDFMIAVKKEEEPAEVGFSATRLGLERVLEKKRSGTSADAVNSDH